MKISLGKTQNSWSDLVGVSGFLKMKRKEIDDLVSKNKEISEGLEEVVLPYENFANVRSFDEIMASDEVLDTLKSAPNHLGFINSGITKIKEFTGSDSGVTQITNHFASKIGNQTADNFVKNSMNTLLENGLGTGTRKIVSELKESNLKPDISGINITAGHISGPMNWATTTGNFLKKSFSDGLSKLGVGAKNFLANNFSKIGGSVVKGLNIAVSLPTTLVGSIGIKIASPVIFGVIIVIFLFLITQDGLVSSVVNMRYEAPLDESINTDIENDSNQEQSDNEPFEPGSDNLTINSPVRCSVENKTVAAWQCIDGNSSVYMGNENCVTSVKKRRRSICTSGCGLVSTSIVLQAHNAKYTPRYVLKETNFSSYGNICNGVSWSMISNTIKNVLGSDSLNGGVTSCNKEWISNEICNGNIVIILFKHEPTGGHWVTAVAVLENGDIALKDPNYGAKTKEYNYLSRYLVNKEKNASIRNCLSIKGSYINNK